MQTEEWLRAQKEGEQVRVTHFLESMDGGTNQDSKRKGVGKGHSRTREHKGRDKSGWQKQANK